VTSARSPAVALLLAILALAVAPGGARASGLASGLFLDLEGGVAASGYNDVRIPGEGGTRFSIHDDLDPERTPYQRFRVGGTIGARHTVFLLYAPLRLTARGALPADVAFAGEAFARGAPVSATYRFDSWRATWRYALVRGGRLELALGATAKIRDAGVALQGARFAEKTDVGFVPLLSFRLAWRLAGPLALALDGDALAAPQGRAEDVQLALEARIREDVDVRVGYRILEGGADNDEVYNFALVHFVGLGLTVRL
jgi:hypothetical protein